MNSAYNNFFDKLKPLRKVVFMIIGYARCSTNETKQDVERQRRELRAMGADVIYSEYESGIKISRQELTKALASLESGDTLVTTEVSRITRSVKQLCEIIEFAKNKKIKLVIGSFVIDCTGELDVMTEAMLQIMGVFAELERKMTIDRIKSGLAHAKAKGVRLGRPKATIADVPKKVIDMLPLYQSGVLSKTDFAKVCNISRPTLYKYLSLLTDS